MDQRYDRRRAARIPTRFVATYSSQCREGTGLLKNVSRTGALIETKQVVRAIGAAVRAEVVVGDDHRVSVSGVVARFDEREFAIRFDGVTAELLELLHALGVGEEDTGVR
ncbi:MAG: PilZ domain-containing protein [Deltaproteobacteria bacterium]|nr:PilZ domain-containing protein [Deltaproteobacteria bacterium]